MNGALMCPLTTVTSEKLADYHRVRPIIDGLSHVCPEKNDSWNTKVSSKTNTMDIMSISDLLFGVNDELKLKCKADHKKARNDFLWCVFLVPILDAKADRMQQWKERRGGYMQHYHLRFLILTPLLPPLVIKVAATLNHPCHLSRCQPCYLSFICKEQWYHNDKLPGDKASTPGFSCIHIWSIPNKNIYIPKWQLLHVKIYLSNLPKNESAFKCDVWGHCLLIL